MEGLKYYSRLCSLVVGFSQNGKKNTPWTPLFESSRELYKLLLCSVCGNMVINPHKIVSLKCKHTVCKKCVDTGMKQICTLCDLEKMQLEEYTTIQLNILNGYRHLCKYMRTCPFFRDTVHENCTIDKQIFIANIIEVADHDFEIVFTNSLCNGTNYFSPCDENPSQTDNSELDNIDEASNKSPRKSSKRKINAASPKSPKKQAMDNECNPIGNENEFNQNSHSQNSIGNDKEYSNNSEQHSASPSGTHMITRGCKRSGNLEIASNSPELSDRSKEKSLKKKENDVSEKCSTRSECSSPEIVFNTIEVKQQSFCACNTNHESAVSSPCYALNCPCYLNDRACGPSCMCKDCVNPNGALSNPVVTNCKNTVNTSGSESMQTPKSRPVVNARCSNTVINNSKTVASGSSSDTTSLYSMFKSILQAEKLNLGKKTDKPPLINHSQSPNNPELFDFRLENIHKFLYDFSGTGEKPGIIRTRSFDKKNFTQQPNVELLRRINVITEKFTQLVSVNPALAAYYINQNQNANETSNDEDDTIIID